MIPRKITITIEDAPEQEGVADVRLTVSPKYRLGGERGPSSEVTPAEKLAQAALDAIKEEVEQIEGAELVLVSKGQYHPN